MATYEVNVEEVEPMSRTYQYRKVMKPMLERKRRARINKCLDELKDLMVGALQSEGESITKLEKADVLELTVRHLRKLKQHHALAIPSQNHAHEKFKAGFGHCATEVRRFVQAVPGVDMHISARLLNHLGQWMSQLDKMSPPSLTTSSTPVTSPLSVSPPAVHIPRIYTPPASPEAKPSLPISAVSPQPLSLIVKSQSTSPSTTAYQFSPVSSPSAAALLQHQPPQPASRIVNPQPLSLVMKSHSPVSRDEYSTIFAAPQKEPINYSPNPTGIKVEIPQLSPVWRPW